MIECLMTWPKAGAGGGAVAFVCPAVLRCVQASLMTHFKPLRLSPVVDRHRRRALTALNGAPGGRSGADDDWGLCCAELGVALDA